MTILKRSQGTEDKQGCGPMMMIVMASLIVLAVLVLFLFEGSNMQSNPKAVGHPISEGTAAAPKR